MAEKISIRETGRRLGVSDTAVRKAMEAERITKHIGENGQPYCLWPDVQGEWQENTQAMKRSHVGSKVAPPPRQQRVRMATSAEGGGAAPVAAKQVQAKAPQPAPQREEPLQPPPPPDDGGGVKVTPQVGPSYAASRAVREAYSAKLLKLEHDEKAGRLVSVDAVRVEAFKVHRMVRDALLNIPDRCAAQLAQLTDTTEVHAYLLQEINGA